MLSKYIAALALPFGAMALNETIAGYPYFLSGPAVEAPKAEYEASAATVALELLKNRLGDEFPPELPEDDVVAIYKLKDTLGSGRLRELLAPDADEADIHWKDIVASSTGESFNAAEGRAVAFLPNVNAAAFGVWSQSERADAYNNNANAEHYYRHTTMTNGSAGAEILEGWGGVTTNFTIQDFGVPDRVRWPYLRELPEFPLQFAGAKVLRGDVEFGVLHLALRDVVDGTPYGQDTSGIEVYASVWYGDGSDDEALEKEREHMIIEIVNLTLKCQEEIEDGTFVPEIPEM